ncbi:THUMP-like domain-containing protein [Aureibaculum conchae]|uniref:THUMP-like domain-containing protein n=1 Tax=Aureibaculum sp. 2308TA14-22 TaxID=3108392 RepID=UPI0033963B9A
MNIHLLNTEAQTFINQNLNANIAKLIFRGSPFSEVTIQELVGQIEAKKKAKQKLPTWFSSKNIYYPNKINIEQTSSEITANYKANLIKGQQIIDITGGFGIDSFAFAKRFETVTHCEINKELSDIANHNFKTLCVKNGKTINADGIIHLKEKNQQYDWIYIDPSRRNDAKGKVFLLEDCTPNVPKHLETSFQYSDNIMVKVSPMLDISSAVSELDYVKEIHVIAIQNEVKELLFLLKKGYNKTIHTKTINFTKNKRQTFSSDRVKKNEPANLSKPLHYIYEPNSAILKAGLFNEVSHQLKIPKLNINSHLYTSNELIEFPGRVFKIVNQLPYNLKDLKKALPNQKANITTRNFPETVAQIRKKTKIKEGGSHYLFFTKDTNERLIVLITCKV